MDLLSPSRLQDLCINLLADTHNILWVWTDQDNFAEPGGVEWRDPEQFLQRPLADRLLEFLSNNGTLTNGILSIFTQEHACLRNVKISYCQTITQSGLQVLSHHKLVSLDLTFPDNVKICPVLQCTGNKSCESLQHLVLRRENIEYEVWPRDDDLEGKFVIKTLSRFNCLKKVDVSDTDVTNTMLTILGTSLLHVENLNISKNDRITDISPLNNCHKTLKSLSLRGLRNMTPESTKATFVTLTGLTYLDVSFGSGISFDSYVGYDHISLGFGLKVFRVDMLLEMPDVLPNLGCLDLSSRLVRSEHALSQFLEAHQSLQTLMLWDSAACQFQSLQNFRPRLTVGGDASLEQYAAVLSHWTGTEQHQGIFFHSGRREFVLNKLIRHLEEKHFPPCADDHLVQVILDMLSTHSSPLSRQDMWFLGRHCLDTICLLLEKKIVGHLEPDTRQRLLPFCLRALQQIPEFKVLHPALRIMTALL